MKKILVPTDFSQCAERASSVALALARKTQAEVHFLHIASVPTDWTTLVNSSDMYPDVTKMVKHCQVKLNQLDSQADSENISARKFLVYNQNYRGILQHIKNNNIDLVVMGSQGASGIKEFQVKNIVFASDFREEVMDQIQSDLLGDSTQNAQEETDGGEAETDDEL